MIEKIKYWSTQHNSANAIFYIKCKNFEWIYMKL